MQEEGGPEPGRLSESVSILFRGYGKNVSKAYILERLTADPETPSETLVADVARDYGLSLGVHEGDITEGAYRTPFIAITDDGEPLVVVKVSGDTLTVLGQNGSWTPAHPTREAFRDRGIARCLTLQSSIESVYGESELPDAIGGSWFWGSVFARWPVFALTAVATVLINLLGLFIPIFIMIVYDRVLPNEAMDTLLVLALGALIVIAAEFALKSARLRLLDSAAVVADKRIARKLFTQILTVKLSHKPRSTGELASLAKEADNLRDFFSSATLSALIDLPFAALFFGVLYVISGSIILVMVATFPAVILYCLLIQIPIYRNTKKLMTQSRTKSAVLVETISCLETVRSVGGETRLRRLWDKAVDVASLSNTKVKAWSQSGVNVAAAATQLATIGVVAFGVPMIIDQSLTMGGLIACVMLGARGLAPLASLASLLSRFQQSRNSLSNLNVFMDLPSDSDNPDHYISAERLPGTVELRDVTFRYPTATAPSLKGISLKIGAGEKVAIVGKVGSGKSTLTKLMTGLLEPTDGQVLVGGVNAGQLNPTDLRANIGYVPQETVLFKGTLRENILSTSVMADGVDLDRAVRISGLHPVVEESPEGLDYRVGERGEGLSGGQRQCVCIARALVKSPNTFLFDEPTSAMDSATETEFIRNLKQDFDNRTLIVVTHRVSLLGAVDRIVVLDKGRIVADGPRDEVLKYIAQMREAA